jgi:spore maturation protein SpmB
MRRPSPKQFFQQLASEIFLVSWTLYKVMIPTLIVVKVLEEMGALVYLSWLLAPLMSLVGLP